MIHPAQALRQCVGSQYPVVPAYETVGTYFGFVGDQIGDGDRLELHGRLLLEAACPVR